MEFFDGEEMTSEKDDNFSLIYMSFLDKYHNSRFNNELCRYPKF